MRGMGRRRPPGAPEFPPPYVGGYQVISSLNDLPAALETASASGVWISNRDYWEGSPYTFFAALTPSHTPH